jgi:hypothetical protein
VSFTARTFSSFLLTWILVALEMILTTLPLYVSLPSSSSHLILTTSILPAFTLLISESMFSHIDVSHRVAPCGCICFSFGFNSSESLNGRVRIAAFIYLVFLAAGEEVELPFSKRHHPMYPCIIDADDC